MNAAISRATTLVLKVAVNCNSKIIRMKVHANKSSGLVGATNGAETKGNEMHRRRKKPRNRMHLRHWEKSLYACACVQKDDPAWEREREEGMKKNRRNEAGEY